MNEEMKQIIDKALTDERNRGYIQGIWDFLMKLEHTHKTPREIYSDLLDNSN